MRRESCLSTFWLDSLLHPRYSVSINVGVALFPSYGLVRSEIVVHGALPRREKACVSHPRPPASGCYMGNQLSTPHAGSRSQITFCPTKDLCTKDLGCVQQHAGGQMAGRKMEWHLIFWQPPSASLASAKALPVGLRMHPGQTKRNTMVATMMSMRAQAPVAVCARQSLRSAAPMPRLMAFNGLAAQKLALSAPISFKSLVSARVSAPAARRHRMVVQMAKKSVGDLTKGDLEGKTVLVRLRNS